MKSFKPDKQQCCMMTKLIKNKYVIKKLNIPMLIHSGGFVLAILDSLIRISLIEKTNHDVLIATVH